MVKHAPVGAHYGLRDWLLQRITAVIMILFTLVVAGIIIVCPVQSFADWKTLLSGTFFRPLTLLFILSLLYHAWVGMRDFWMDYVSHTAVRLALESATAVLLLFYFIWSVAILWG